MPKFNLEELTEKAAKTLREHPDQMGSMAADMLGPIMEAVEGSEDNAKFMREALIDIGKTVRRIEAKIDALQGPKPKA